MIQLETRKLAFALMLALTVGCGGESSDPLDDASGGRGGGSSDGGSDVRRPDGSKPDGSAGPAGGAGGTANSGVGGATTGGAGIGGGDANRNESAAPVDGGDASTDGSDGRGGAAGAGGSILSDARSDGDARADGNGAGGSGGGAGATGGASNGGAGGTAGASSTGAAGASAGTSGAGGSGGANAGSGGAAPPDDAGSRGGTGSGPEPEPSDAFDGGNQPGDGAADSSVPPGARQLTFVAHPDDELLFFNPDIEDAIVRGETIRIVYFTSGDADGQDWQGRENGVHDASAAMAGVVSTWSCANVSYAGHQVVRCFLVQAPQVSSIFMRLPDGHVDEVWVRANDEPPFAPVAPASSLNTIDGAATYSRAGVIDAVTAMIQDFAPTSILTMDSTTAYGSDHNDHIASAMFALAAAEATNRTGSVKIYRGYSIDDPASQLPPNLSPAQHTEKARIMSIYDGSAIIPGGQYDRWCERRYSIASTPGGPARFKQSGGPCIDATNPTNGARVTLSSCTGASTQAWTVGPAASVVSSGGLCLTASSGGASISIATCAGTAGQKWAFFENGQLRGAEASCLTVGVDGTSLALDICRPDDAGFAVPTDQLWTR